ncbi:Homeobox protein knotted-1-like 1 [Quillaja saponaria]|uniref:Homeobox protein knotted-1-like 1 n=1 Tax=Quillaja saponaria TaxID=32244 RepID=A0AAD7KNQ8_QUISA|nr:Homeobox protein knotted-1-like 1 [Quillaja saponaria]
MKGDQNSGDMVIIVEKREKEKEGENEVEILKRMISSHSLYERLVEIHLNCLKVGFDEIGDQIDKQNALKIKQANYKLKVATVPGSCPELEYFMVYTTL